MHNLLTTQDIANYTNRSVRAIQMNSKVDDYLESFARSKGAGRPAKLYRPEVLELWGLNPNNISLPNPKAAYAQDKRADYGVPRGIDPALWIPAVQRTKENFLSMPTKNLREACRMTAVTAMFNGEKIDPDYLYNRLTRNRCKTGVYRSPFYAENWNMLHDTQFRKRDNALNNHPFTRYNMFSMFRNGGLLGKGYGSKRVIVVDDFKRDVWVEDEGEMTMPWGLLFIDGITNYPLTCIPAESINTDTIAAGILMTAFNHGIHEDTVWVFETSRAMNNINIRNLIKSLYTKEQLEAFKSPKHWVKLLFPGQSGPYVNSPAQIAQSIFKSKVERSIKNFKDEYDGVYNPTTYQGGDRKEGVQLSLSGSPLDVLQRPKPGADLEEVPYSKKILPIHAFWQRFGNWVWGKYISTPRTDMYNHFIQTFNYHKKPSISEVHDYFTSDDDGTFRPDMSNLHRFAYVLYYAQSDRHPFTVKVTRIGQYTTTINNVEYHLRCDAMNEFHVGLKVCTIPIPMNPDQFIVMDVTVPDEPVFIGIANDRTVRTFEQAGLYQKEAQQMRQSNTDRMSKDAKSNYRELGDDFLYESKQPKNEDWIQELGAKQSKLLRSDNDTTDEQDNVLDVEEIEFKSKAAKDIMKRFDLDNL